MVCGKIISEHMTAFDVGGGKTVLEHAEKRNVAKPFDKNEEIRRLCIFC